MTAAKRAIAVALARRQNIGDAGMPIRRREAHVEEAGAGNLDPGHVGHIPYCGREFFRQIPRLHPGRLGEHHGGVTGHVAVGSVTRRFDGDAVDRQAFGQAAVDNPAAQSLLDRFKKMAEWVHVWLCRSNMRSCSRRAYRSVMPAI